MDSPGKLTLGNFSGHIGAWLRHLRGDKSLSEVAKQVGVSSQTIANWEKDNGGFPNSDLLCNYAKALGVTPHEVAGWQGAASTQDAWRFISATYGYEIGHIKRIVTVDLDGTATVEDWVSDVMNFRGTELKLIHRVAWGKLDTGAQESLQSSFHWADNASPAHEDRVDHLRVFEIGSNGCERQIWVPDAGHSYSYFTSHRCTGMYRMFPGDTHDQTALTDPHEFEWCRFYIDKPVRELRVEIRFAKRYSIGTLHRAVWNSDSPFHPHRLKTEALKGEEHFSKHAYDHKSSAMAFTVRYPAHGFSYGLAWELMGRDEFCKLFPAHARPSRTPEILQGLRD